MCVLLICKNPTEDVDLIVLHNRDELTDRPFEKAQIRMINNHREAFGLDSVGNGTWLAVTEDGSFSTVLNLRVSPNRENKPKSRGDLPLKALADRKHFKALSEQLQNETEDYAPFNLVLGGVDQPIEVFSSVVRSYQRFNDRIFSLSNNSISDVWKKPTQLEHLFQTHIIGKCQTTTALVDEAFRILENTERLKPNEVPITGYPPHIELELSAQFVKLAETNYQTVVSTVFVVPKSGKPILFEKNYLKREEGVNQVSF